MVDSKLEGDAFQTVERPVGWPSDGFPSGGGRTAQDGGLEGSGAGVPSKHRPHRLHFRAREAGGGQMPPEWETVTGPSGGDGEHRAEPRRRRTPRVNFA